MAQPARERLLEAAATAEGSLRRHHGAAYGAAQPELPENQARRDAAAAAGPDDPESVAPRRCSKSSGSRRSMVSRDHGAGQRDGGMRGNQPEDEIVQV